MPARDAIAVPQMPIRWMCLFSFMCIRKSDRKTNLSTTKDTKVHEERRKHYVLTADSRIRKQTLLSLMLSLARTPKGNVMFLDVTWPERTPNATGTARLPTIRITTSCKV